VLALLHIDSVVGFARVGKIEGLWNEHTRRGAMMDEETDLV
jgi:hypothetical protein